LFNSLTIVIINNKYYYYINELNIYTVATFIYINIIYFNNLLFYIFKLLYLLKKKKGVKLYFIYSLKKHKHKQRTLYYKI